MENKINRYCVFNEAFILFISVIYAKNSGDNNNSITFQSTGPYRHILHEQLVSKSLFLIKDLYL